MLSELEERGWGACFFVLVVWPAVGTAKEYRGEVTLDEGTKIAFGSCSKCSHTRFGGLHARMELKIGVQLTTYRIFDI